MSGVEIAVVALKVFPVLLKTANDFVPIFEGLKNWWSFEENFKNFISVIHTESISYQQNLQFLLSPLGLDLEENGSLHKQASSKLWHDPAIRAQLKRRIQDEHLDWFIGQLQIMNDTLQKLFKLLPDIRKGEVETSFILCRSQVHVHHLKVSFISRLKF
jgi:hypothetical protein